jgi:hypothetical protein
MPGSRKEPLELSPETVNVPSYIIPTSLAFSTFAIGFLVWLIYFNSGSDAYDVGFLAG